MEQVRRKAILLGSTGGNLNGVNADLAKVRSYLRSPVGGAWLPGEIVTRTEITWYSLRRLLIAARNVDYLFVYFSGHGFENEGNRFVWINKEEAVQDLSLFNGAHSQLVICDSCRTGAAIGAIPGMGWTRVDAADFWAARAVFDYYIANSPAGQTIIHMTQRGQEAGETPAGGWGTSALLDLAVNSPDHSPSMPVTIVDGLGAIQEWGRLELTRVVAAAGNALSLRGYGQTPEIIPVSGDFEVPFAIRLLNIQTSAPLAPPPKKKANGLAVVGGLLLAGWIIDQL